MSRWSPDARERLERAAVELFLQQGFGPTTVPEITARAGLTTRTFFRYFADKREVLFAGDEIPELATRMLAEAPAAMAPIDLIVEGLRTVIENRFEGRKPEVRVLREIIRTDEGLRERDLRKRAALSEAIRTGFIGRDVPTPTAALLAETTVTVLYVALDQWLDQDDGQDRGPEDVHGDARPLFEIVLEAVSALRTALGTPPAR